MFDFAYKLQLHYNIYRLVFTIWMVKIINMKIPLVIGYCKLGGPTPFLPLEKCVFSHFSPWGKMGKKAYG